MSCRSPAPVVPYTGSSSPHALRQPEPPFAGAMAARFSSSNKSELASLLSSPPSLPSTSTTGNRLQPAAAAATATSPSMSKNLTVLLLLRLARGRALAEGGGVLARQGRALAGAVKHAGSSSAGAGCCRAECLFPEKMALSRLASRAPGEAGLRLPPRAEAADGFLVLLALSGASCVCFSVGATVAGPTPPEVRMGRKRRREYSTSDEEKYPRPEQSSAGAGAARWLAAKVGL